MASDPQKAEAGQAEEAEAMTFTKAQLERNRNAAVKHGAQSLKVGPRAKELAADIRAVVPLGSEADEAAITLLGLQLARIERASAYLDEVGLWDEFGQPQGVLRVLSGWENSAARLLHALGMTPLSRAHLGLDVARIGELAGRVDLSALSNEELATYRILTLKAERKDERDGEH